jgi:hypothetical protein
VSSGLLRRVALVRTDISVTLMKEAPGSSETSVLTRATRRNKPEDTILYTDVASAVKERLLTNNYINTKRV